MNSKLTAERLSRRAIVYVRQSSPGQVIQNQESKRRQYGLADRARELGFSDVSVIDDDLGRSGSGLIERPGFQRLVAEVCSGEVGAIFCIEASRLARNGRDWHHLIELCGMTNAVVVDPDGIYDPGIINDRLLLGLKGTMSEFELNLLRQRSLEAIRQKAKRGELQFCLPVGFCWAPTGKIEIDPDRRVQEALNLAFAKMTELGSMRQVLLWFRREKVCLPSVDRPGDKVVWKLPVYNTIIHLLRNPMYAGAYVFGKTEARTKVVNGRAHKTSGHFKPVATWTVLIRDHHPGYISWEQFARNQEIIAANSNMKSRMLRRSGRGGRSLLAGILRCGRCGRMLRVVYSGTRGIIPRYQCNGAHINHGENWCISFGGLRVDEAVAKQVLDAISGNAVEAALEAADEVRKQQQQQRKTLEFELEQARYEAQLAARRYEAVDPENRLVAAELEFRWNAALQKATEGEEKLQKFDAGGSVPMPDRAVLMSLAQDLPAVWNAPTTDMRLKQRIVRILIDEIVVDINEKDHEVVLLIHWAGGRHSELRVKKKRSGEHGRCTTLDAIEVMRQMAVSHTDEQIATTLNRLGLQTGTGNSWNEQRVYSARRYHQLPAFDSHRASAFLTLEQAAGRLAVSPGTIRRLIERKTLPATQVVPCAPWKILIESLELDQVREAIKNIKNGVRLPRTQVVADEQATFSIS